MLNKLLNHKSSIAIMAAVLFNNWLLGIFLNWHLFYSGGSVSEFSATTQPSHWVFKSLDIVSGILFILLGAVLYKFLRRVDYGAIIAGFTSLMGLANIIDAAFPLPCSGTVDPICSAPVRINIHRVSLPNHIFSSVVIGVCYLVIPIAGTLFARNWPKLRKLSIFSLTATILFFALLASESLISGKPIAYLAGYSQELQMLVLGIWFIYFTNSYSFQKSSE